MSMCPELSIFYFHRTFVHEIAKEKYAFKMNWNNMRTELMVFVKSTKYPSNNVPFLCTRVPVAPDSRMAAVLRDSGVPTKEAEILRQYEHLGIRIMPASFAFLGLRRLPD